MKTKRVNLIYIISTLILIILYSSGCVKSYMKDAPLEFKDIPYVNENGKPWPHKCMAMPQVTKLYNLSEQLNICYIEENPESLKTVILIHGLGSYLKFWKYQIDAFTKRGYRVLALDLPGFGKSDKPSTFPYTTEAFADVVREFAVTVKAQKPVLMGHSMGSHTAMNFAIRYPKELTALVLASPAGLEKFTIKEQLWFKNIFSSAVIKGTSEYGIWGSIRYNTFYQWKNEYEWLIEERARFIKNSEFSSYAYANVKTVQGLTQTDFIRDNLSKIQVPSIVFFGGKDRLIPNPFMHGNTPLSVMKHSHNIPKSKLIKLKNCGHVLQIDCSEKLNKGVFSFLGKIY